jgi:hypothetical protein
MRIITPLLLVLIASVVAAQLPTNPGRSACGAITERDATVLAYLVPAAFAVRTKGYDVGIIREPGMEQFSASAIYAFRVDGPENPNGSSLLGHYGVDRCTGQVTDLDLGTSVTSPTLRGVQRILLRR